MWTLAWQCSGAEQCLLQYRGSGHFLETMQHSKQQKNQQEKLQMDE